MKTIPRKIPNHNLSGPRMTTRRSVTAIRLQTKRRRAGSTIGTPVFGEGSGLFGEGGEQIYG